MCSFCMLARVEEAIFSYDDSEEAHEELGAAFGAALDMLSAREDYDFVAGLVYHIRARTDGILFDIDARELGVLVTLAGLLRDYHVGYPVEDDEAEIPRLVVV